MNNDIAEKEEGARTNNQTLDTAAEGLRGINDERTADATDGETI